MKTVEYDAKVDVKKRITIRNANYDYYHVREMEDGTILLEPRELYAPFQISANTLATMDESIQNFKAGKVSAPINLSYFEGYRMCNILMGVPKMEDFWNSLYSHVHFGGASKDETKTCQKLSTALFHLSQNLLYPALETREVPLLSKRYDLKVCQSYIGDKTPSSGRIFWIYGPRIGDITIIAVEPYLDDDSNADDKITLPPTD